MKDSLGYPVKYAVMKVSERGQMFLYHKDIIHGYIVSKCFVVEEDIKYNSDGELNQSYQVVFPYKDIYAFRLNLLDRIKKTIPLYDSWGKCYNADVVSRVFDTYEKASIAASLKNKKLRSKLHVKAWESAKYPENIPNFKHEIDEFDKVLKEYGKFESDIMKVTEDMVVTKNNIKVRGLRRKGNKLIV